MDEPDVTRFAPSPNGPLHLGHALSALVGFQWARSGKRRFLVRIEDIDPQRSCAEHVAGILEDLDWLGIVSDGPLRRQSEHLDDYRAATRQLEKMGLVYPCFATRGEIAAEIRRRAANGVLTPADPDGTPLYPGICRDLPQEVVERRKSAGEPFALRIDMARALAMASRLANGLPLTFLAEDDAGNLVRRAADPSRWGDAVIVRKDTPTSYHLAVVVDDALQGVTRVTRGEDLLAATDLHRLLQVLLGLPEPRYHHHALLRGPDGRKLSKSEGAESLGQLRARGVTPAEIRQLIGLPAR
ncbi:MAG: tRNA glutamyl-Q(34) synthetase GluQRS [Hyphomicrobiaceae bacterium]|nr:tRNA glutamyl-Q(34) synthetase GluQRS [Hyphomicrobiaceae bacterium]